LPLDAIFVLTSSERNIELGESMSSAVQELRTIVQEGIRVQRGGADPVDYIDAANAVRDAIARQNHVIFGRRGCGKTLLLHETTKRVPDSVRVVYVNCEDYKQHSFPNVLIEILDRLFAELERNLPGWFGKKSVPVLLLPRFVLSCQNFKNGLTKSIQR